MSHQGDYEYKVLNFKDEDEPLLPPKTKCVLLTKTKLSEKPRDAFNEVLKGKITTAVEEKKDIESNEEGTPLLGFVSQSSKSRSTNQFSALCGSSGNWRSIVMEKKMYGSATGGCDSEEITDKQREAKSGRYEEFPGRLTNTVVQDDELSSLL